MRGISHFFLDVVKISFRTFSHVPCFFLLLLLGAIKCNWEVQFLLKNEFIIRHPFGIHFLKINKANKINKCKKNQGKRSFHINCLPWGHLSYSSSSLMAPGERRHHIRAKNRTINLGSKSQALRRQRVCECVSV